MTGTMLSDLRATGVPGPLPMTEQVVEVGLLLPKHQIDGLITLSVDRGQSVAELLRDLIRRELNDRPTPCGTH